MEFFFTLFLKKKAASCSLNEPCPAPHDFFRIITKMARAVAQGSLALDVSQIFAPVVDFARELRFGRLRETFGEDPYLAGELGYEFVIGL